LGPDEVRASIRRSRLPQRLVPSRRLATRKNLIGQAIDLLGEWNHSTHAEHIRRVLTPYQTFQRLSAPSMTAREAQGDFCFGEMSAFERFERFAFQKALTPNHLI
jgi:hypothetical protein